LADYEAEVGDNWPAVLPKVPNASNKPLKLLSEFSLSFCTLRPTYSERLLNLKIAIALQVTAALTAKEAKLVKGLAAIVKEVATASARDKVRRAFFLLRVFFIFRYCL
jgi:hypothetical protein